MKRTILSTLLLTVAFAALTAQSALAAGTPACTTISNNATLTYSVGGTVQPTTDATTPATFIVGNKVIVTVEKSNATAIPVIPNSTVPQIITANSYLTFTVTNGGNALQDYTLNPNALNGALDPFTGTLVDSFDLLSTVIAVVDDNNNGIYDDGVDVSTTLIGLNPTTTYPTHSVAGTRNVFIIPNGVTDPAVAAALANGAVSVYSLEAVSFKGDGSAATAEVENVLPAKSLIYSTLPSPNDTCNADVLFAEGTHTSNVLGEVAYDGKDNARNTFVVSTTTITISKASVVFSDPVNNTTDPKAIPGAVVRYTIIISNAGSGAATLTSFTDALVNELQIVSTANGASWTVTGSSRDIKTGLLTADAIATDGLSHPTPGSVGGTLTAALNTILAADVPNNYTAGELKSGESVAVTFYATIQ